MDLSIKIRNFEEEDFEAVVKILASSFKNKFHALTNLSDEMILQLLKDSGVIDRLPFEGYLVGEIQNQVQGVMLLKWQKQIRPRKERLSFIKLSEKYGVLNICKFLFGFIILQEALDEGECYIEHIAVNSEFRGCGLGTVLLEYGKEWVKKTPDLDQYTLYVAAHNRRAINLYERQGFRVKKSQSSLLTTLLLGEKAWHYMMYIN
ncbi:GNAT family N-acetyltransferase [Fusibacter ferrireducens]|uniref:GNAT family N-acetyltransferase n=1 Tax=Fusibacter ferrireducens TaxID=2785058 RepID=A0ABR9ZQ03_9FIRM|nr:N-acetyltransferase [Fusibacter ferrireducens]MBF4692208.1 GNAT family N-acetyltransferase [Fusibacter ferrireducens]